MLPLLVAGGAVVAALFLSGCDEEPSAPQEPVHVPFPQNKEEATTEDSTDAGPPADADAGVPFKSFAESLPHSPQGTNMVPANPCGIRIRDQGMSRFATSIWGERSLKIEDVVKVGDLSPLAVENLGTVAQDRVLIRRGNCPTPMRQLLRVTQEDFLGEPSGMRLASLSLLACYQTKKCSEWKIQFAIPAKESLRELFMIDENKDGTEDLLIVSDGKYSYVIYGEKLNTEPRAAD